MPSSSISDGKALSFGGYNDVRGSLRVRSWWNKLASGGSPLKPVKMIEGALRTPHDFGPALSGLLDGEPRRKWHLFDRTAHADHGDAPIVNFVVKWRIRLLKA